MEIAVWCASQQGNDPVYLDMARALGVTIAERGHGLVYGGSRGGLMGAVAGGCLEAGGTVTGVTVNVPRIIAERHPGLTRSEVCPDLITRKARMIELADAFIALPGGPGTFDELGDVITLLRAGVSTKPVALVNIRSYYDPLAELFARMVRDGFADPSDFEKVLVSADIDEVFAFLEAKA